MQPAGESPAPGGALWEGNRLQPGSSEVRSLGAPLNQRTGNEENMSDTTAERFGHADMDTRDHAQMAYFDGHQIEFGATGSSGFCYGHQSFDCIDQVTQQQIDAAFAGPDLTEEIKAETERMVDEMLSVLRPSAEYRVTVGLHEGGPRWRAVIRRLDNGEEVGAAVASDPADAIRAIQGFANGERLRLAFDGELHFRLVRS